MKENKKNAKKAKGRRAYLNDFKLDEKGEYQYEGLLYQWAGEEEAYRHTLLALWGLGVLQMISVLAAGFVEAPGVLKGFYVIFPYIVSLVASVSVLWGIWRLTEGKKPLRAYIYKASVAALPVRTLIVMIAGGISVLGEIYYEVSHGTQGQLTLILLFLLLEIIPVICAALILKKVQNMPWEL